MVFDPLPVFKSGCLMDTVFGSGCSFFLKCSEEYFYSAGILQYECASNYPDGLQCSTESLG